MTKKQDTETIRRLTSRLTSLTCSRRPSASGWTRSSPRRRRRRRPRPSSTASPRPRRARATTPPGRTRISTAACPLSVSGRSTTLPVRPARRARTGTTSVRASCASASARRRSTALPTPRGWAAPSGPALRSRTFPRACLSTSARTTWCSRPAAATATPLTTAATAPSDARS